MLAIPLAFALLATVAGPANAQVYRCGNAYSQTPCPQGVQVDVTPAMSDPAGPASTVIQLCRRRDGQTYWVSEPCSARGWTLLRTARVPADASWDEQVGIAQAQYRSAQASATPPPVVYGSQPSQASRKGACAQLDERVKQLDGMGRAGSQYYDLDWVRRERQAARDQQFRLRC